MRFQGGQERLAEEGLMARFKKAVRAADAAIGWAILLIVMPWLVVVLVDEFLWPLT